MRKLSIWNLRLYSNILKKEITRTMANHESTSNEYAERAVCNERDIAENGMKVVDFEGVEGGKVLLVKQGGKISALGTKCSHYGAPLTTGVLSDGRIRCPWHGACFNINTGDIEDFPGLDSIPCYSVETQSDGTVKVKAKKSDLVANKRMKAMAKKDPSNKDTFVIAGAGAAGLVCAETLRQEGFKGRLVLVSAEPHLPYDRIKLSKMLDAKPDAIKLRHDAFYKEHDLELMLNQRVEGVDPEAKKVTLSDGTCLDYTALFIATGNRPRKIDVEGINLENVFVLRSLDDANAINNVLSPDKKVVVIGSSFIGMEVAAYCVGKSESVTVVGRSETPFKESLGAGLGARIKRLYEEKGAKLVGGAGVKRLVAKEDSQAVGAVELSDSTLLPADVVILGLGSIPETSFLPTSVKTNPNGTLPVSKYMETSAPGIWAGGDIVEAEILGGRYMGSVGHWGLSQYHGKVAAFNMLGKKTPLKAVPFFWTMLFGIGFRYAGYVQGGYDEEVTVGDLESLKACVYYIKGGQVVAVTTVASDPVAAQFAEHLAKGESLTKEQLEARPNDWWAPAA